MAKYLKQLFNPTEKKTRTIVYDEEIEEGDPRLDSRRKLSISRSGRLKQANRKRHSLSKDLYGENYKPVERPKTVEYHVKYPANADLRTKETERRWSIEGQMTDDKPKTLNPTALDRRPSADIRVLETEIDSVFEAIDKT